MPIEGYIPGLEELFEVETEVLLFEPTVVKVKPLTAGACKQTENP